MRPASQSETVNGTALPHDLHRTWGDGCGRTVSKILVMSSGFSDAVDSELARVSYMTAESQREASARNADHDAWQADVQQVLRDARHFLLDSGVRAFPVFTVTQSTGWSNRWTSVAAQYQVDGVPVVGMAPWSIPYWGDRPLPAPSPQAPGNVDVQVVNPTSSDGGMPIGYVNVPLIGYALVGWIGADYQFHDGGFLVKAPAQRTRQATGQIQWPHDRLGTRPNQPVIFDCRLCGNSPHRFKLRPGRNPHTDGPYVTAQGCDVDHDVSFTQLVASIASSTVLSLHSDFSQMLSVSA